MICEQMDKISVYITSFLKIFISFTFWGCGQETRRCLSHHLLDICCFTPHDTLELRACTWDTATLRTCDFLLALPVSQQHLHGAWGTRSVEFQSLSILRHLYSQALVCFVTPERHFMLC